jgi:ribosomal 50S subunit-recycling heat shock protein
MRIDKFLKVSRILKRRTVAQEACDSGKVIINGKEVKPAHPVKEGDVVEIDYVSGTLKFKVLQVKEVVKKDEASSLYEIIE